MAAEIVADDAISRCIIYARFFNGGFHVDEVLWAFGKTAADGAAHESAVLRRLAVDDGEVHRIGCKIASAQNVKRGNPNPGDERRYYCGFRTAIIENLVLSGDGYEVVISSLPEDGESPHVDVALRMDDAPKNLKAARRTVAGLALAKGFGPPVPYTCDCDADDEFHPIAKWGRDCLFAKLPKPQLRISAFNQEN